jgi:hypothetical protein
MSNETKSGNMNEHGGSGKNDLNRTAPKSGQQSQGPASQPGKNAAQQGGSDHKGGQQSQGGSLKDNEGTKHAGSANMPNDPKKSTEAGNKGAAGK